MAEIGKISIRVSPDLKGFHAEVKAAIKALPDDANVALQAQTKEFTAKATAAIKSLPDAKVKVKADTDRFKRQMSADLNSLLNDTESRIPLTIDGEKFRRELHLAEQKLKQTLAKPIPTKLSDAVDFRKEIDSQVEAVRRIRLELAKPVKIRLEIDEDFDRRLQQRLFKAKQTIDRDFAKAEIAKIAPKTSDLHERVTLRMDLETSIASAQAAAWRADQANRKIAVAMNPDVKLTKFMVVREQLKALFHIPVKLEPKFDPVKLAAQKAADALFGTAADGVSKVGSNAAGSAVGLISFQTALLAVVAAVAVLIPPVLALGAGLITLAPGLLGILPAAGAVALGLNGIKKAAMDAGLTQDTNGDKKGGGALANNLQALQESVSKVFASGLTPMFKQLNKAIPALEEPIGKVSQGLVDMAGGLINAVSQGPGLESIKNISTNLGQGFTNAAPGVEKFTQAVLRLVEGISTKFPGLGTWISQLGDKFAANIEKFVTVPQQNGFTALENTINGVRSGLEGLTGIFQAFWNQGMSDIQDPAFGQRMLEVFDKIRSFVTTTLPVLSDGFRDFAQLLNAIVEPFKLIGKLWDAIGKIPFAKDALRALAPEGVHLGEALKSVLGTQDDAIRLGQERGAAARSGIQKGLFGGGSAGNAVKTDGQSLFGDQFKPEEIGRPIILGTNSAIQGAKQAAQSAVPAIQQQFSQATQPLQQVPTAIGTAMSGAAAQTQKGWTPVVESVTIGAGQIEAAVSGSLVNLPQIVTTAFAGVSQAANTSWAGVVRTVGTGAQQIVTAVSSSLVQLPAIASQAFSGMSAAIQGQMALCVSVVAQAGAQIIATMQSFAGPAVGAGVAIGAGFAQGLRSMTGVVGQAASDLMGAAKPLFPNSPAEEGPFSGKGWVKYSGQAVGRDFAAGMDSTQGKVYDVAHALMQAVSDVFGSASGVTFNIGIGNMQPVMSNLSNSAADFNSSLSKSVAPAQALTTEGKQQLEDIKRQLAELELQRKELKVAKNNAASKEEAKAIQAQMDAIQAQKDALGLEKDKLDYAKKYGGEVNDAAEAYKSMLEGGAKMPFDFAKANSDQFLSDIGVGGGAITGLVENLAQWAPQAALGSIFNFNVSNVDEAISIKNNQVGKEAMQYTGR